MYFAVGLSGVGDAYDSSFVLVIFSLFLCLYAFICVDIQFPVAIIKCCLTHFITENCHCFWYCYMKRENTAEHSLNNSALNTSWCGIGIIAGQVCRKLLTRLSPAVLQSSIMTTIIQLPITMFITQPMVSANLHILYVLLCILGYLAGLILARQSSHMHFGHSNRNWKKEKHSRI